MTEKVSITIKIDAATLKAIKADAGSCGDTLSGRASYRLKLAYSNGQPESLELTPEGAMKRRLQELAVEAAEAEADLRKRKLLNVKHIMPFLARDHAVMKSVLVNIPFRRADLTPEQIKDLRGGVEDALADIWKRIPQRIREALDEQDDELK